MSVEFPIHDDPRNGWIARKVLSTATAARLTVSMTELEQAIPNGTPVKWFRPFIRLVAPARGGGVGETELPHGGTHIARFVERLTPSTELPKQIKALRIIARTFGFNLFGFPAEIALFTRTHDEPGPGLVGHLDSTGGSLIIALRNNKMFDLLPTAIDHPFGDLSADQALMAHAISDKPTRVELSPGDVLYLAPHVVHWAHNHAGHTQHARLTVPTDVWQQQLGRVLQFHRDAGSLNETNLRFVDEWTDNGFLRRWRDITSASAGSTRYCTTFSKMAQPRVQWSRSAGALQTRLA